jgi:hypothetical protein
MPVVNTSGQLQFYISDLQGDVLIKVENRVQDVARAQVWLRDAIIEIAGSPDYRDDFCELEEFGPLFNLTPGTQEYAESNLVPAGDVNQATLDILMWTDPGTNAIRKKLNPSHYQETDRFNVNNSQPTKWYRFSTNIGFYPVPDKAYQVQTRILRNHPINDAGLGGTVILLPRDWNEILVWSAVERGFAELEEFEKAGAVHAMLFGDPKYPTKPGLVAKRKKKREQEAWRQEQQLRPICRPYTYFRR